jgi:hypothetical protein
MAAEVNEGFDPLVVFSLLDTIKERKGVDFRIVDTARIGSEELSRAYEDAVKAAVWNRYPIRKVFGTNSSSGCFFGKEVPALIVWNDNQVKDVFPHEEDGGAATIRAYLESQLGIKTSGSSLAREMDESRTRLGPIDISTAKLIHEGRRR